MFWYRSTCKAEQDKSRRARAIQKATEALSDLRERLQGPRTRFRTRSKVEQALAEILAESEGDTIAFHTDVEAERGVSLGSGARGWRIPSVDE